MKIVSFIVISWNRPEETAEVVDNLIGLKEAEGYQKEIIVVNNGSDRDYSDFEILFEKRKSEAAFPMKYLRLEKNLGVAGGRNEAIQLARGEILVSIDDDAFLQPETALQKIVREFESQENQKRHVAIVTFKVVNYYTRKVKPGEFPHKQYDARINLPEFLTYYFLGGAHAMRREVIGKTGPYPGDFFYGAEEYDMAYRALDAGFRMKYVGDIILLHKVSPEGRKSPKFITSRLTENRLLVAYSYLPLRYVVSQFFFWSVYLLKNTRFDVVNLFRMYRSLRQRMKKRQRQVLKPSSLQYLKEVEARLWY